MIAVYDIGGSHIGYGYFDLDASRLVGGETRFVPLLKASEENTLSVIVDLVRRARDDYQSSLLGLSIAVPGPFDYAEGVSRMRHKLSPLYGLNLKQILSEASGISGQKIHFINDAAAFLLGAQHLSDGFACRSVGITLGTGIGSAFSSEMEILLTGDGVPPYGEVWNLPYSQGIVEDAISTRAIEADYLRRSGLYKSVKAIAELAYDGDHIALKTFADFGQQLGRILESICMTFHPDRIILGGGISASASLFLPFMLSNPWCASRVMVAQERESAPLVGAAIAWDWSATREASRETVQAV